MKRILFVSFLSVTVFVVQAQTVAKDEHAGHNHGAMPTVTTAAVTPAVVLEDAIAFKEGEFDFGKIPQGKPVTHVFELTNSGKTAYKVDNVVASCGCTTPQWDKEKIINSGEKSIITVGYNAAAEGPFSKSVTVTYNGTQTKVIVIKGEVWKTPAASAPANGALNDLKN